MEHHLSIEESIRFGWEKTRQHSALIFQAIMTLFAVEIAGQVVQRVLANTVEGMLATAALFVLSAVLGVGFTLITLHIAEGQHVEYKNILPPIELWLPYFGATILAAIVMVVPLIAALAVSVAAFALLPYDFAAFVVALVVAAGVLAAAYFALRYVLVRFAILQDTGIINSLRTSAHITRGHKWWLLGFLVTVGLLNLLGAMLLFVGLLVTIPVTMLALGHVYVKLRGQHA